jgi:hypothetical protein
VRPIKEKLQLVFEHRYLNGPVPNQSRSQLDNTVTRDAQVRSAYALVDDLPYNLYVQYGLYRPMFGHVTPDHTSLANTMIWGQSAGSARYVNRALSIGGSPNVPFFNLHMIKPVANATQPSVFAQEDGFALNLGGRHVMYGLSYALSYWKTKFDTFSYNDLNKEMINLNFGGVLPLKVGRESRNLIANYDSTLIEREFAPGSINRGQVDTVEVKYELWRENYFMFNFAKSNVRPNLERGDAQEMMYGFKSFLWPGSEFELLWVKREDVNKPLGGPNTTIKTDLMQAQVHLYF